MAMPKSAAAERRSKASAGSAILLAAAAVCWSSKAFAAAHAPWHQATAVSQAATARGALAGSTLLGASRSATSQAAMARQAEASDGVPGVRIGLLTVTGAGSPLKAELEKLNVNMTSGFFQTELPDAFQLPISAKWLAMSQTVDAIVVAHGPMSPDQKKEALRIYQSVSLNFNVPLIPMTEGEDSAEQVAKIAVSMAEIRMQALMGTGPRNSIFFGIGKNASEAPGGAAPGKKEKVYF